MQGTNGLPFAFKMDVIEIDSSESDDEGGKKHMDSQSSAPCDGVFHFSTARSNYDAFGKEGNVKSDSTFKDNLGTAFDHAKKRVLPTYMKPTILKNSSECFNKRLNHGSSVMENNAELNPTFNNEGAVDVNSGNAKRTLPASFQPAILENSSENRITYGEGPSHASSFMFARVAGCADGSKAGTNDSYRDKQDPVAKKMQDNQKTSHQYSLELSMSSTSSDESHVCLDSRTIHSDMEGDGKRTGDGIYIHEHNDRSIPHPLPVYNGNSSAGRRLLPEYFGYERADIVPKADANDFVHRCQNYGSYRALPPSLAFEKHASNSNNSEVNHSLDVGEQRHIENDERIIYQEALQILGQPKVEDDLPVGVLTVSLLKHQRIALAWMVKKEKSTHCAGGILADDQGLGKTVSAIALIQKQRSQQHKFTSESSPCNVAEALNLDEDDCEIENTKDRWKEKPVASTSMNPSSTSRRAAGTLVVCPASILRQWARELDEKVTENFKLSVLIYHGGMRSKDPVDLAQYDVVLTTYTIVVNEVPKQSLADEDEEEQRNLESRGLSSQFARGKKKQKISAGNRSKKKGKKAKNFNVDHDSGGPLARLRWFRVILDEAQTIKNHRTLVANACSGLRAKRRWCLSGTPIQNSIDDLYSYFRFLKYDPYSVYGTFCSSLKYPISRDATNGFKKLQAVLQIVLLRRTKDMKLDGKLIVDLPPKDIRLTGIDFSTEERAFYMKLESDSRRKFKAYAREGTLKQNYATILLMLLRLRQACDHPLLVKGFHSNIAAEESLAMAKQLPKEMLKNLLDQLEASQPLCGVCIDAPEDAVVTMCGHVFCYQCISERLSGDDNTCPAIDCKEIIGSDLIFSRDTLKACISGEQGCSSANSSFVGEISIEQDSYLSSKIRATLEILNSICCLNARDESEGCSGGNCSAGGHSDNPQDKPCADCFGKLHTHEHGRKVPIKAIVFTQWTTMLNLLETALNRALIQYRRLDGTMSLVARDRSVKDFNDDPEVTVMLMSLKAGNLGLNMVTACHVILLDLWWNPTTEDQAIDRAHRIGQTRTVVVSRLTIKDTVEDRILELQEEKRRLVSSALGEQQSSHASHLTLNDLRYLFRA